MFSVKYEGEPFRHCSARQSDIRVWGIWIITFSYWFFFPPHIVLIKYQGNIKSMQEFISTLSLFFPIYFCPSLSFLLTPPSLHPHPNPPACALHQQSCWSWWDSTANCQDHLTPRRIVSFSPTWTTACHGNCRLNSLENFQLNSSVTMAGDYGCGKYRVLLWLDHCEDFSLGHSAAFGHRRRTGHQALLLWIPCKFAIQSTKLAELSKELTATITDGHVPPSPLLCPLLRVHCDASQDSSYLWATENCSHFWVSWVTSQASPFTENDTEHSQNDTALAVAVSTQMILGASCLTASWVRLKKEKQNLFPYN